MPALAAISSWEYSYVIGGYFFLSEKIRVHNFNIFHPLTNPVFLGVLEHPHLSGAKHQSVVVMEISLRSDRVAIDEDATVLLPGLDDDLVMLVLVNDGVLLVNSGEEEVGSFRVCVGFGVKLYLFIC